MMHFLLESGRRGLAIVRSQRSFVYTLALVVIIPVAFLWSGQQFLTVAREHHDRAEKNRIGLLHDALGAYVEDTRSVEGLMRLTGKIVPLNPDIRRVILGEFQEGQFVQTPLAGVGDDTGLYGELAKAASVRLDESVVFSTRENGEHVRVGVRALAIDSATPNLFLVTTFSTEATDALYQSRVRSAYGYLGAIVFVLLLLIVRHARIINYAQLYQELKGALAAKTTFINMTAHELRSPLTAMRGYASMLLESEGLESGSREYARRIEESSAYMIGLVSDMLDVAKIESGGMVLATDVLSVKDVVAHVVERLAALGAEHHIALNAETIPDDLRIMADRVRLEQIFTNLISNAIKYTKEGSVTLSASVVHGKCEIRIKDTGMGMTAEDQHKLFSPYFRTEDAESSKVIGTGLGMWITKQFIEKMGGTVDVESIHGVGTHVVVVFPLARL